MTAEVSREPSLSAERLSSISPRHFKFALSHWLWWLTITAALLAVHRGDMANRNSGDRDPQRVARGQLFWKLDGAANLAVTPFHAIAIWAFGLAIWRVRRSQNDFPIQPGHWLLVCLGVYVFSHEIVWLAWQYIIIPSWSDPALSQNDFEPFFLLNHLLLETSSFVVVLVALVVANCRIGATIRWRAVFWLLTTAACVFAGVGCLNAMGFQFFYLANVLEFVGRCTIPVACFGIFMNAVIDSFAVSKVDALHFIGAIVSIAAVIHSAMWDIAFHIAF